MTKRRQKDAGPKERQTGTNGPKQGTDHRRTGARPRAMDDGREGAQGAGPPRTHSATGRTTNGLGRPRRTGSRTRPAGCQTERASDADPAREGPEATPARKQGRTGRKDQRPTAGEIAVRSGRKEYRKGPERPSGRRTRVFSQGWPQGRLQGRSGEAPWIGWQRGTRERLRTHPGPGMATTTGSERTDRTPKTHTQVGR